MSLKGELTRPARCEATPSPRRDSRSWHKCEVPTASSHFRVRGQCGNHLLGESISHFDPTRTSRHVRFFAACGDQADIQSAKCEWLRFMITRPSHVNLKFVT